MSHAARYQGPATAKNIEAERRSRPCHRSRRLKVPIVLFGEQKDRGCSQDEYGKISQPELICKERDRNEGQKGQRANISDSAVLAQEVLGQRQDVLAPLAQRRNGDLQPPEAVQEVLAE